MRNEIVVRCLGKVMKNYWDVLLNGEVVYHDKKYNAHIFAAELKYRIGIIEEDRKRIRQGGK